MDIVVKSDKFKEGIPAVYKITFDEKWIYIGSSTNIKKKLSRWKCAMSLHKHLKNKNIKTILHSESKVEFDVLEIVSNPTIVKDRENSYLSENENNPLLLNRCPTAYNGKNLRKPFGYQKKPKTTGNPIPPKPVAQFDKKGILIAKYPSVLAASKALKTRERSIRHFLQGKKGPFRGTTFKLIRPDGSFIEPKTFIRKKHPGGQNIYELGKGKFGSLNNRAKAISMYSQDGVLIRSFGAILEASRETGIRAQSINKALSGERRIASGYIWKYSNAK